MSESNISTARAEYEAEYLAWTGKMTAEELAVARSLGIAEPDHDATQINGKAHSVEDLPIPAPAPKASEATVASDLLGRVLIEIAEANNPTLHLYAWISALGLYELESITCEQIGKKINVSKQRFSLVRAQIIDKYALEGPPRSKSRKTRAGQRLKAIQSKKK